MCKQIGFSNTDIIKCNTYRYGKCTYTIHMYVYNRALRILLSNAIKGKRWEEGTKRTNAEGNILV